jgi:hypothetical protein
MPSEVTKAKTVPIQVLWTFGEVTLRHFELRC